MRGINLSGMEGSFGVADADGGPGTWNRALGPREGQDYPVFPNELLDYYASQGIGVIRLLFSWERVQSELWGPLPAPSTRYGTYFEHYTRVVDYATGLGIVVIVEPWQASAGGGVGGACWRGQAVGTVDVDLFAFADFWGKLAAVWQANELVHLGLVNEPNGMSTMQWWTIAQKCVDAIRAAGSAAWIHVPGNGWTGAGSWTADWYDTDEPGRSNAYGWLNANGEGAPLFDPLGRCGAEVHLYLDENAAGRSDTVVSTTIARERLAVAVSEAEKQGYQMFVGEVGLYAGHPDAATAWSDLVDYMTAHQSACTGFAWWAGGETAWWADVHAPHFSVSPTRHFGDAYSGTTVNMEMIRPSFALDSGFPIR